jgi:hypothetical protein
MAKKKGLMCTVYKFNPPQQQRPCDLFGFPKPLSAMPEQCCTRDAGDIQCHAAEPPAMPVPQPNSPISQKDRSGQFIVQQMLLNMVELHCNRKVLGTMKPDKQVYPVSLKKSVKVFFYYA